ncbi:MAG TPA: hypothetical protein VGA38_07640 [Candidatus Limnocylindria bacterium]
MVATTVLSAAIVTPVHDAAVASDSTGPLFGAPVPVRADPATDRSTQPAPKGFIDEAAKVSFDPPVGWLRGPATALNAQSDPPDPAQELVRYQLRIGDASLYALPVPITGALIRDAGAIITVGLARADGDMLGLDVDPRTDRADALPVAGFFQLDEQRTYEGLHVFTRYFIARETDRRLVARAVMPEEDWAALEPLVRASFDSLRADPRGPNAPAAPPPPAPLIEEPAVVAAVVIVDASLGIRQSIIDRAASMLATPYVWGGNVAGRGMDCSAYVSMAWGVARYTTESIGWVSSAISKEDLRAGDAMNLTMSRDPQGYGHIRMFEAWANEAHTLVWVYEETPPRAVHRVVVYDDRYQPIRLDGLSNAGSAALVPAPAPAPEPAFVPSSEGGARNRATPRPYTPRPYVPRTATPRPLVVPSGVPQLYAPGSRPIVTATPRPTPRPTVRPTPRPTATPHR